MGGRGQGRAYRGANSASNGEERARRNSSAGWPGTRMAAGGRRTKGCAQRRPRGAFDKLVGA